MVSKPGRKLWRGSDDSSLYRVWKIVFDTEFIVLEPKCTLVHVFTSLEHLHKFVLVTNDIERVLKVLKNAETPTTGLESYQA